MVKLIADSGSTKTDWCVVDGGNQVCRLAGQGINPFQQSLEKIEGIVRSELVSNITCADAISEIEFYGAGCRDSMIGSLERMFRKIFVNAAAVGYGSQLMPVRRQGRRL